LKSNINQPEIFSLYEKKEKKEINKPGIVKENKEEIKESVTNKNYSHY